MQILYRFQSDIAETWREEVVALAENVIKQHANGKLLVPYKAAVSQLLNRNGNDVGMVIILRDRHGFQVVVSATEPKTLTA